MVGLLQGILALTKRVERFQILHGALLLIGGVRRARPEYCRQAILSFPLHTFYVDSVNLSLALSDSAFVDIIKERTMVDVLEVGMGFNLILVETLKSISTQDTLSVGLSPLFAQFLDSTIELAVQPETVSVSVGLNLATTTLIENVVTNAAQESVQVSLGAFVATLGDV